MRQRDRQGRRQGARSSQPSPPARPLPSRADISSPFEKTPRDTSTRHDPEPTNLSPSPRPQALEQTTSKSGAAQRRRGAGTLACAALAATTTTVAFAEPARASTAPPPVKPLPIMYHEIYADKELVAPTKSGRVVRRRKGGGGGGGGGGSEDDGDVNGERWNPDDGGGFNGGDDANNGGGDWNGWRGGGDSGGSGGSGSGGGSNSNDSFEDEFYRRVHMRGIDDHNLLWLWQALCVVTLAGSVRHVLERGDRARVESAARLLNPAESCAAAAHSMELAMEHVPTVRLADGRRGSGVGTRGGRMALTASITQSHLNLPKTFIRHRGFRMRRGVALIDSIAFTRRLKREPRTIHAGGRPNEGGPGGCTTTMKHQR